LSEYLGMNETEAHSLSKLIDKKEKMPEEEFFSRAQEVLGEKTEKFVAFLNIKDITVLPEEFAECEIVKELENIIENLGKRGITNVVYDPSIMRGFDYYTGVVFEVNDTSSENNRSMFGGGRYDDLVGIFDVEKVSGIGFGAGDVIIRDFLETHDLIPEKISSVADLYLCVFEDKYQQASQELAEYLRGKDLNVSVDISGRKIASQIKTADKQGVKYIVCIGEDEVKSEKYKLKDIESGKEKEVSKEEIVKSIKANYKQTRKL
ncbi:MAG: ATP phosphoribosyltransferase regulatory subunit, partial [Candidatus Pacebacteria bacterium]|nr:ATP phosphoribosyltransferase regulatory subunit [Candidatus Paceibacterota bacterium]